MLNQIFHKVFVKYFVKLFLKYLRMSIAKCAKF